MKDGREVIWRRFFGDAPMPQIEEGAVEKYFGCLNREQKNCTGFEWEIFWEQDDP